MIPVESNSFSSFDGTKIYYETRGAGKPIIFIYGIACLMNHWRHQVDYFSQTHQVITFDLRGHHQSEAGEDAANLNLHCLAKDLIALMDHLKLDKADLVAHSFAVPLAILAYELAPNRIRSMALLNGFVENPMEKFFGLQIVEPFFRSLKSSYDQNPALFQTVWRLITDNPVAMRITALAGGFNIKLTHFKDIEIYMHGLAQMPLNVFFPLFDELLQFKGTDLLGSINCPVLVVSGEKDFVTPAQFQKQIHDGIPGSKYLVVPYATHCTMLDFPDYLNLKLAEFLN